MKYIPTIAALIVQLGTTVFIMEVVRRDLFLATGAAAVVGLVVYFLLCAVQERRASLAANHGVRRDPSRQ